MHKANPSQEQMLSRRAVAARWGVSTETVKRRERAGELRALKFNCRLIRYALSEVERYEREAMTGEPLQAANRELSA